MNVNENGSENGSIAWQRLHYHCFCVVFGCIKDAGDAEIAQLDKSITMQEDVLRLQVAVKDFPARDSNSVENSITF